jgi:hypothetical protein
LQHIRVRHPAWAIHAADAGAADLLLQELEGRDLQTMSYYSMV